MLYGSEIDSFLWRDRQEFSILANDRSAPHHLRGTFHPVVLILSLEKAVRVSDATRERRQE
jgi:hypothetical protein